MNNFNKLTNEKRIDFIKQNAPNDYYEEINKLENSRFIFIKSENCSQCFISIDDPDNSRTQLVVRFDNGFCEISDLSDYREDLSTQWKKFIIREQFFKNRENSQTDSQYSVTNTEYKQYIDLKDCIITYMTEFNTPIVAHSEIEDWAMFLQNHFDETESNFEVLIDQQKIISFRKNNDELISVNDNVYTLNEYHDEDDLNTYLLDQNFDEELLKELIDLQGKYRHLISPNGR